MTRTLRPRTYLAVDRASKLLGLLLATAGLAGAAGTLSPILIVVGLGLGVATVFVDAAE